MISKTLSVSERLEIYIDRINEIAPGIDLTSASSFYTGEKPLTAKIVLGALSDAFKQLIKVKKRQQIIHYTSLQSMLSIVESESLRFFNCLNLNDPKEIGFANAKYALGLSEKEIEHFKRNYFVGAFCEYDPDQRNDDFNLWRLYGNNGDGAAVVFEIENMDDNWENVFFGKVLYDEADPLLKTFRKLIIFHNDFNKEHELFENTPELFPVIGLYFKDNIWSVENEFRIFTSCPFDEFTLEQNGRGTQNSYLSNTVNHTLNFRGDLVSYLSLPLNKKKSLNHLVSRGLTEDMANHLYSSIPHLKVTKVILGYNVPVKTFWNVAKLLENKARENHLIQLEYSQLKSRL